MGLFDFFSKEASDQRKRDSASKKLGNMYYQSADRMAAAQLMAEMAASGDEKAIGVLLSRFEHINPSSTVDQDEKEYVVQLLNGLGDKATPTVKDYVRRTSASVIWPMRFLRTQLGEDGFRAFMAEVLSATDTGYTRDPKKKIGLVQLACENGDDEVCAAVAAFVEDDNEDVRFHALDAILQLEHSDCKTLMTQRVLDEDEDSGRVLKLIAETFAKKGWKFEGDMDAIRERLPGGYWINDDGSVKSL